MAVAGAGGNCPGSGRRKGTVGKDGEREAEDPSLPTAQPFAGLTSVMTPVFLVYLTVCSNLH